MTRLSRGDGPLWALRLLRLVVALSSTSIIHPDEHFQNPEIAADLVFAYSSKLEWTWEWLPERPCRSIVPIWLTTGWAFLLLRLFDRAPSARTLLCAQRLAMWTLSIAAELAASAISPMPRHAALLFATSPIALSFLSRPLSNSTATLLMLPLLSIALRVCQPKSRPVNGALLGAFWVLAVVGVWSRIDFVAFALPSALVVLRSAWPSSDSSTFNALHTTLVRSRIIAAFLAAVVCIVFDTFFFVSPSRPAWQPILTPLNSLVYNLSSSNLASHGKHPRWLHIAVNWPMLFGAGLPAAILTLFRRHLGAQARLCAWTLVSGTALLSVQPHQEPRFLLPLIAPLCLLLGSERSMRSSRVLWALWLLHSCLATVFFAYLHHGGLLPAMVEVNRQLSVATEPIRVVVWQTYMPPRHLTIPVSASVQHRVVDLAGASWSSTLATLQSSTMPTWLVAPVYMLRDERCLNRWPWRTRAVHLDPDDLGEIIAAGWDKANLGVWTVVAACQRVD